MGCEEAFGACAADTSCAQQFVDACAEIDTCRTAIAAATETEPEEKTPTGPTYTLGQGKVSESGGVAVFTLTRSFDNLGPRTFEISTESGTAAKGADFGRPQVVGSEMIIRSGQTVTINGIHTNKPVIR